MTTALYIAYALVGTVVGYIHGRWAYQNGLDRGHGKGSTGLALFIWVIYGAAWPALLLLFLALVATDSRTWNALGRRLFG